jgi:aryl-alcohol dehydrogenase-like predicted oxidoreductase
MQYRTVGKTGVQVSSLCFGTMSFGGNADEETMNCAPTPLNLTLME